jgi:hypothetical protein
MKLFGARTAIEAPRVGSGGQSRGEQNRAPVLSLNLVQALVVRITWWCSCWAAALWLKFHPGWRGNAFGVESRGNALLAQFGRRSSARAINFKFAP